MKFYRCCWVFVLFTFSISNIDHFCLLWTFIFAPAGWAVAVRFLRINTFGIFRKAIIIISIVCRPSRCHFEQDNTYLNCTRKQPLSDNENKRNNRDMHQFWPIADLPNWDYFYSRPVDSCRTIAETVFLQPLIVNPFRTPRWRWWIMYYFRPRRHANFRLISRNARLIWNYEILMRFFCLPSKVFRRRAFLVINYAHFPSESYSLNYLWNFATRGIFKLTKI